MPRNQAINWLLTLKGKTVSMGEKIHPHFPHIVFVVVYRNFLLVCIHLTNLHNPKKEDCRALIVTYTSISASVYIKVVVA